MIAVSYRELDDLLGTLPKSTFNDDETPYLIQVTDVTEEWMTCGEQWQNNLQYDADTLTHVLWRHTDLNLSLLWGVDATEVIRTLDTVRYMFSHTSVRSVDLSPFRAVTTCACIFRECGNLRDMNINALKNCTDFQLAFEESSIRDVDMSECGQINMFVSMFQGCTSLEHVVMPGSVPAGSARELFQGCTSLESVVLPEMAYNISADNMFNGCTSLKKIYNWYMPRVPGMYYNGCFRGCSSLESIYVKERAPHDAGKWRAFSVSHGSGTDDTVTVYATDGTVEASATVRNADGRSVEATDWVDELLLSGTEIPGTKIADMMATRMPITGNKDAADPSQDTFTLWARDGDKLRTNVVQMTDSDFNDIFSS